MFFDLSKAFDTSSLQHSFSGRVPLTAKSRLILYADNILLYNDLQSDINSISDGISTFGLQLNPNKTKFQSCQVSRIAHVIHAIGSFHTLTRKPGLLSCIFVHAWNRDMASSFTSIRDHRIKMPHVLGHYLLYNGSSTAR